MNLWSPGKFSRWPYLVAILSNLDLGAKVADWILSAGWNHGMHTVGISGEGRVGKGSQASSSERTKRPQRTCSQTLVSLSVAAMALPSGTSFPEGDKSARTMV